VRETKAKNEEYVNINLTHNRKCGLEYLFQPSGTDISVMSRSLDVVT